MSDDNRKFSQDFGQESTVRASTARESTVRESTARESTGRRSAERKPAVDFDFLATQTFADPALEREVLELFATQARRIMPTFATSSASQQADTAHLIKGSARGIGAWAVAAEAERYEATEPALRHLVLPALQDAVSAAERAIRARLDAVDR